MSLRFNINDRSDYIAEYNRLQQKITAKIQNHEGPCGEDGVRGEDATGLVTTSLYVATFLCNLMQFIEGPNALTITEDSEVSLLHTFTSNVNVNWSIEQAADTQYFQLKNQTLQSVELHWAENHNLDYATKSTYDITLVGVRQSNQVEIRKPISISINEVDADPPVITGLTSSTTTEAIVGTYLAYENVTWNLNSQIFQLTNVTTTSVQIEFVTAPTNATKHTIVLTATDTAGNVGNKTIDVQVPLRVNGSASVTIDENERSIGTYTANTSNNVTWTLTGSDKDLFDLTNNVSIEFKSDPEPRTYNVTLNAELDGFDSVEFPITITVNDVDDTAPVLTANNVLTNIDENTNTLIIGVYEANEDIAANGWSLGGDDANDFTLTPNDNRSATLALKASPDFETKSEYRILVTATDGSGNTSAEKSLVLTVNEEGQLVKHQLTNNDDVYFEFQSLGKRTVDLTDNMFYTEYKLPSATTNQEYDETINLGMKSTVDVLGLLISLTSIDIIDIVNLPNGLQFEVFEDDQEVEKTDNAYVLAAGTANAHNRYELNIFGTPTESKDNIQLKVMVRGSAAGLNLNIPLPFDQNDPLAQPLLVLTPLLGLDVQTLTNTLNILFPRFKIEVPHVTIQVSGGQFDPPYYTFTPPVTTLQANTTYVFQRQDNATSHPFSINNENGITGTSTVTVTTGEANTQIPWVCTLHSSMNGSFTVV